MYLSKGYFVAFDTDYVVALENFPYNMLDQNFKKKNFRGWLVICGICFGLYLELILTWPLKNILPL